MPNTSLVARWIGNLPANAEDLGLTPGLGGFHMLWSN